MRVRWIGLASAIGVLALPTEIALAQNAMGEPPTYDSGAITGFLENYTQTAGVTVLEITVAADGSIKAASVVQSSGSQKLDDAAIQYTKNVWRWKPPAPEGAATEARVRIKVSWSDKDTTPSAPTVPASKQ
jgi:TonB family protein